MVIYGFCDCNVWPLMLDPRGHGRCGRCHVQPEVIGTEDEALSAMVRVHGYGPVPFEEVPHAAAWGPPTVRSGHAPE